MTFLLWGCPLGASARSTESPAARSSPTPLRKTRCQAPKIAIAVTPATSITPGPGGGPRDSSCSLGGWPRSCLVADEHADHERLTVLVVGDQSDVEPGLRDLGFAVSHDGR